MLNCLPAVMDEISSYFSLLVLIYFLDNKKYDLAIKFGVSLIEKCQKANSRNLDSILAKVFYFVALCFEYSGNLADCRTLLLNSQRTAFLKQDLECQAVLINSLLRNYLAYNLYEQAEKLVSKSTFPETASNNQLARYFYYLGNVIA